MNRRSLRWGLTASGALAGFYVVVLAASGGWEHLADQARADWWLLTPIILAFGTQVGLSVELRHRHHAQHLVTTTGPATGDAVLTIEGLGEPVTARWALPQGR